MCDIVIILAPIRPAKTNKLGCIEIAYLKLTFRKDIKESLNPISLVELKVQITYITELLWKLLGIDNVNFLTHITLHPLNIR